MVWRGRDQKFRDAFDAADSPQAVLNDVNLRRNLRFIIQLLKIATATTAKVRARWRNPGRGRRNDFFYRSKRDISLHSIDTHPHPIAWRRQGDHHRLAICMSETET